VRELTQNIGPRVAGTPGEIEARDYIKRTLESYGYVVEIQEFPFDGTRFRTSELTAAGEDYRAVGLSGSPSANATGPIVAAGIGRPSDFPAGTAGAIALIERGELTFTQKVTNAVDAGASGVIIYNNEDGPFTAASDPLGVPAVSIARADGVRLRDQVEAGVTATIDVPPAASAAFNVIARPPGTTECRTVSGGHYDSVPAFEAADDNASGTAGVIELARLAAANRLPGANCFVLFGAEEFGLFGSMAYVEEMSDAEINGLRAMLNLDVIGTEVELGLIGSDDMVELARVEAQEAGIEATRSQVPAGSGSDHFSFESAGVPVVFFYRHDPLIHTQADAIGRILPESLEDTVRVAYGVLEALNSGG
jgi:Zn-dependent M28 family amino/carboxypeptidase